MQVCGDASQGVRKTSGEVGECGECAHSAESSHEWCSVGIIHHTPCAFAALRREVPGVDRWRRVSLFGDARLECGLPRGELGIRCESQHDAWREIGPAPFGEGEGPHLGPEPACELDRWSVDGEFGGVESTPQMVEDCLEFRGVLDAVGLVGNTHANDRNGKYRQCPVTG